MTSTILLQVFHWKHHHGLRLCEKKFHRLFESTFQLYNISLISRICLQLHETTIKILHRDLTFSPILCQKWTYAVHMIALWHSSLSMAFKVHVLLKEYSCKHLAPGQRKYYALHSKCWSYPGIWELDILKMSQENVTGGDGISNGSPENLISLSSSWPGFSFLTQQRLKLVPLISQ